jgi:hypothetical protein
MQLALRWSPHVQEAMANIDKARTALVLRPDRVALHGLCQSL